jgi:hypothetical protein
MSDRASFEELMEFANKVRNAGGGNPLDALMPAVPQDPNQCLIAKNLNFNCQVNGSDAYPGDWCMWVDDRATRDKIAATLNLPTEDRSARNDTSFGVRLPADIGQVATDFDNALESIDYLNNEISEILWADAGNTEGYNELAERYDTDLEFRAEIRNKAVERVEWDDEVVANVKAMLPYIEASELEAFDLATTVTDDGKIVI